MSSRKPYQIRIVLDIHAITCPGVWLCQSGNVELSFSALDYHFRSKPHPPRFPLFMHETFKMEGSYSEPAASVTALERIVANETIEFALWQNGRRLAYYTGRMGILLDRSAPGQHATHSTETNLIMKPSSCFPGTISPKIELLASIDIIDTCRSCKSHVFQTLRRPVSRQLSDDSKPEMVKSLDIRRLHQRPVCHSRRNPNYWKSHFVPAFHLDDYAFTARFCDKCVERLSPSMDNSAYNFQRPEDNVPRSDYSSPSLGYRDHPIQYTPVNFDCGHGTPTNINTIHPKSCEICQNYRTYFKLMSIEYQ